MFSGQMKCNGSRDCIPLNRMCDGISDCADGSDESATLCANRRVYNCMQDSDCKDIGVYNLTSHACINNKCQCQYFFYSQTETGLCTGEWLGSSHIKL